jgi:hypothetical protein
MVPSNTYSIRCLTLPADAPVLEAVGCLRVAVWAAAGALDAARFPTGQWLDADDAHARHWVAESPTGELVAAARLVWHADPLSADRDVAVWLGRAARCPFRVSISAGSWCAPTGSAAAWPRPSTQPGWRLRAQLAHGRPLPPRPRATRGCCWPQAFRTLDYVYSLRTARV